jgi:predicted short-subunit dehydrogenase-like oxidoreductase (DUF2520 family)
MGPILLIGTGRLAFHLGQALRRAGIPLAGVAGRNAERTAALAKELDAPAFMLDGPLPACALRILAVSDDAIGPVAAMLPVDGTMLIHLSGSKPLELLAPHEHRGVLWPIQSFSPGPPVDLSHVPLVVDAGDVATLNALRELAHELSATVVQLPHEQRRRLHLSAVIASNFPVFLLREAERLLRDHAIDPALLHPLWAQATHKALSGADRAVTGPARRGDVDTIRQQLGLLADEPELRRAYSALSALILHTYHPDQRGDQDL